MTIEFIPAKNKTSAINFGPNKKWGVRQYLLLVVHWVAGSFNSCLRWFQAPNNNRSSAHYVISERGKVVQMVSEEDVAWHAGISRWKNYPTYGEWNSLNPCSIGIELAGPPSMLGLNGWQDEQIAALVELCKILHTKYSEMKLIDHSRICSTKIDVIKGTGYVEDIFPWKELLDKCKMEEA
jgi:N-acetyl-anhydromuramyl-L-alanine amidase AmpD